MSSFQLAGLDHEPFEQLFELSDEELATRGIVRKNADSRPGYPCRVSLEDANVGDELLLFNHEHHAVGSPYRASGPIYIGRGKRKQVLAPGVVPDYVTGRVMSVRAYSSDHMMLAADVSDGSSVASVLEQMFANSAVAYIHLHNAKQGCYSCAVSRVPTNAS